MARGSVIKRGDSWRICVELPPENGRRRQKWETFHGTKREAERRLTELLALVDQRKLGADTKMTLAAFLERWLQDYASAKAPKTCERYRQLVRNQIVPHLGDVRLDKLTPSHIVRLLAILREAPKGNRREGTLSPQTLRHVYTCLHVALGCAVKWQLLAVNPADAVDAPPLHRLEMRTFTVEQARDFLAAAAEEGAKWHAYFYLAITAGLRTAELKGLRWQDVDLDKGAINVQRTIQRVSRIGRVVRQPKTAGSRRPVPLDGTAVALLRRHRAEQAAYRLQMGPLWQDQGLVFASEVGTAIEDCRIHKVFTRVCHLAGVPRIRPYDLRHCCATFLLAAGVHPKVVAERLGHSSVNLTLTTYSHVLPTLQQDAAETLGRLLKP